MFRKRILQHARMKLTLPKAVANPLKNLGLVEIASGYYNEGGGDAAGPVIVQMSAAGAVTSFLQTLMFIFACVLMLQRNDGFNLGAALLICCCCSPCYLAYALAFPTGKQKIHL